MNQEKNILITGNTGFVGTNLSTYLNKTGYKTTGVTRSPKSTKEYSYTSLTANSWNKYDAFIHLAGKAHDLKGVADDSEYFEVNTKLTKTLFDQFLASDCKVFVYISSVKAVADEVEGILTEATTPNPITVYGKSKLAAENYLTSQKLPSDKFLYILRPCMIHGPGNKGNLNLLYQLVNKGIPYPLGDFENKRSFLTVENLCFVIENLISRLPESGIYNVADDEAIATNTLVELIGEASGKTSKIWKLPKGIIQTLGKVGTRLHLPFNTEKLQKLTENYVVSNAKIKKNLKIDLPVQTKQGLINTIKSFKNNQ
ncbi:NAD-dependent epimerase/dehydratase family protein [Lutibacter sp. HS1-25]|uniref:NAD-dependent epimerase/dehydratase family protein n=1 Tax=Lutibacter sp. HS1-25 TaxID=2485000 RepID=UPI001013191E|nr:NAD-dependent epimerase/dehydratase family protein [Lutibacter sp. HS1-25]RXP52230.1 NAD-dependent epimerase/dehydratase family protein [Lutibacter sp. HS1-25]